MSARYVSLAALLTLGASIFTAMVSADRGYQHVVREGETLASIAQRYYGDPRRENILVAENGLTAQGGSAIVVGVRLRIPHVGYHRVRAGETWQELGARFFGDARRAFVLVEANHGSLSEQPDEGAEILIPYPLRHVAAQHDTVTRVAKAYYGGGTEPIRRLKRFNGIRGNRLTRGQIILVPLDELLLSEAGREVIVEQTGEAPPDGGIRARQSDIDDQLPRLSELSRRGNFAELVALGNRLLGAGALTGSQLATIHRELATGYIALNQYALAVDAFQQALRSNPHLQMDSVRTSPRVMRAFEEAQRAHESEHAEERDESATQEGDEGA